MYDSSYEEAAGVVTRCSIVKDSQTMFLSYQFIVTQTEAERESKEEEGWWGEASSKLDVAFKTDQSSFSISKVSAITNISSYFDGKPNEGVILFCQPSDGRKRTQLVVSCSEQSQLTLTTAVRVAAVTPLK